MVNKLRKKFVITAMLSLLLILVIMIGVINLANYAHLVSEADNLLQMLSDNDGFFPDMKDHYMGHLTPDFIPPENSAANEDASNNIINEIDDDEDIEADADDDIEDSAEGDVVKRDFTNAPRDMGNPGNPFQLDRLNDNRSAEMPYQSRYFWVKLDSSGASMDVNLMHIATVTEDTAIAYAQAVAGSSKTKGFYHSYRYITKSYSDGSELIIFTDRSSDILSALSLLLQSLLVGLFTLIAMFVLVFLFSGRAVAPAVESMEKQKRFITDAGHELKTPLAIISANIDVLELESGKSEWTSSIRNQVKRMNSLVKNLLTLSRMDEERMHVVYADFDMSATVKETALSFEAVAESSSKKYTTDIEEGIHITGDKNAINQLTSLLLDNAMKYSNEKGSINVILSKNKNIILEVSNTTSYMPSGNLDRLFDRFYRADSSRSREKGGYGIGLSVARAIAQSHGGDIQALKDGDRIIRFVVTLPLQLPKNLQNKSIEKAQIE